MLEIKNLSVSIENVSIIESFSIILNPGCVSVLCGANGSGKSTLINALIGHPSYAIAHGDIVLDGASIKAFSTHERARHGILVIMQHQVAIPGLLIVDYFYQLHTTLYPEAQIGIDELKKKLEWAFDFVGLDQLLMDKSVCEGFSGGQKKRFELVHVLVLNPRYIILDEVDSGLDFDGIGLIPRLVLWVKNHRPKTSWLFITHNQSLIESVCPDQILTLESRIHE